MDLCFMNFVCSLLSCTTDDPGGCIAAEPGAGEASDRQGAPLGADSTGRGGLICRTFGRPVDGGAFRALSAEFLGCSFVGNGSCLPSFFPSAVDAVIGPCKQFHF